MDRKQIIILTVSAAAIAVGILAIVGTGGFSLLTGVPELLILGGFTGLGLGAAK